MYSATRARRKLPQFDNVNLQKTLLLASNLMVKGNGERHECLLSHSSLPHCTVGSGQGYSFKKNEIKGIKFGKEEVKLLLFAEA